MKLVAGLDIGNGYVKGVIKGEGGIVSEIDIPSGAMLMTRPNLVPTKDSEAMDDIKDIYNRLDVNFVTDLVPDPYRRLFGARALTANGSFEEFDVVGNRSKANQTLSKTLVLGLIAGKALADYFDKHKKLPDESNVLAVEVDCGLALPIAEYALFRHKYANDFKHSVHTVNIHNFETTITVKIKFTSVKVLAEGASAQFAITAKGEPLMKAMLMDVRRRGLQLEDIEAKDVLAATHTVGIDIGEGTVNFPVFSDGRFNTDASMTFDKGFGSVLTSALQSMQEAGFAGGFNSRKQIAAYLQKGPSPIKKAHYAKVKTFVDEEILFFAREVAEKFGHVLAQVGASTEVTYVYGGGANSVKDVLYPLLLDKVREMSGMDSFPVLYLDASYSRHLNREGLYIAATHK